MENNSDTGRERLIRWMDGRTQKSLASKVGATEHTVSAWLRPSSDGGRVPSPAYRRVIAEVTEGAVFIDVEW